MRLSYNEVMRRGWIGLVVGVLLLLIAAPASAQNRDAINLDKRARQAYRDGEFSRAISFWQRAFNSDNTYFDALYNIALAYEKQSDPKAAIRFYRKYISLTPNRARRREAAKHAITRLRASLTGERSRERLAELKRFKARLIRVIKTTVDVELANAVDANKINRKRSRRLKGRLVRELTDEYADSVTKVYARQLTVQNLDRAAEIARKVVTRLRKRVRGAVFGAVATPDEPKPKKRRLPPDPNSGFGVRIAGYVIGGAGLLVLALGGAEALTAGRLSDDLTNATGSWSQDLEDKIPRGQDADDNAKLLSVVGGITMAVGAVVWAVGWKMGASARAEQERYLNERSVSVRPVLTPGRTGLSLVGRF